MRILASQYITITAMFKKKKKKKKKWTNHSLLFNASAVCWIMSCHLFRHHPDADSAHAQVRPEQHTLISVFKLNSCKLCQFKHLRARGCELTRAVRRFVRALIRCAQTRASERTQILSSLWSIVWMDKFTQKLCQNTRLGKYPSRHSRLNVQYQCTGSVHSLKVTALS